MCLHIRMINVHEYTHDQREENKEYYYSKTKKEIYCLRRLTHTQSLYTCITHRDGQIYSIYAMHICTCTRLVCCTKIFNCKA